MRYEEYLGKLLDDFARGSLIRSEDFPAPDLYADQVVGFLNENLKVRASEKNDRAVTRGLLASSVKNDALPPPVRRKYTKDHVIRMALICRLKNSFRTEEIGRLMKPFTDNYGSAFEDKFEFEELYGAIRPVLENAREAAAGEILEMPERMKEAMRAQGMEADDATELLALILALTVWSDTAEYAARGLFEAYFSGKKGKGKESKDDKRAEGKRR